MKNVVFYFDNDIELYTGWKEGFEDFNYYMLCGHKSKTNVFPSEVFDLYIIHNPHENTMDYFKELKQKHPTSKNIFIINKFEEFYKNCFDFVDLWVEPCFYDKITEKHFLENNFPFYYCPMASQESLVNFHTELDRKYDLSISSTDILNGISNDSMKDIKLSISGNKINQEFIFGNTKVNYNYIPLKEDYIYLNQKAFDIPFSGNFELCNVPVVSTVFENKVGYTTKEEFIDKVKYYINHEEERTRMSIKSYEICIRDHAYTWRIRDLLKKLRII